MIKIKFILFIVILSTVIYSCNEDESVTPNPPPPSNDTSLSNFNNLVITEGSILSFITLSAVDLFKGQIVVDSNRMKDANLVTNITIADTTYYLATGDIFDNISNRVPGFKTRFKLIYPNLTQQNFDTIKTMPDTDTTLTENDFTSDSTGLFGHPLLIHPAYGFYLKGKYDNNLTPKQVFGVLYIDSTYYESGDFKLKFDVKLNKNGQNKFKSQ